MARPSAGELTQRIEIQENTPGKDGQGGIADNWTVFTPAWAKVNHLSGSSKRATAAGGGKVTEARTEFTMYFKAGVTADMRITHRGKIYDISHVNNYLERNEYLIIEATEGVNHGR